jgi:hypothetical protein
MPEELPNPSNRFVFLRIFAICLGLAGLGAALAFSVGSKVDSPVGIAGALLVLFAVLTGLAALVTTFVLDVPAIFRFLNGRISDGDRRNRALRERARSSQSVDQLPDRTTAFSIFVVAVILLFNVAIIVFLFSPLSKNPIAVLIVALAGFAVALSFLISARVRAWLKQLLTTGGG